MQLRLYRDDPPSERLAQQFRENDVLARLKSLDARARRKGLEGLDPAKNSLIGIGAEIDTNGRVTKNSYGVLNLSWQAEANPQWAAEIDAELDAIRAAIHQAHGAPLQYLIWAGMGGSAEDKNMYQASGLLKRGPRLYLLDSTDPAKLKAILEDITTRSKLPLAHALKRILIVGMAMGMTSYEPVINLEKLAALYDKHGVDSKSNFVYMTLPGSLLDQFAAARGYRRIELQLDGANSTAGRHSAPLTRGSLYPLGLAKNDLAHWIRATALTENQIHTAWQLAAFLEAQGRAGRDKVTLALPKQWAAALWTKQNFEESLGKSEAAGIKVIIGEKLGTSHYRAPRDPAQDRLFLMVQIKGIPNPHAKQIDLIRRAGYPVAVLTFPAHSLLSAYLQFIHYTVCGLGVLRNMNFVTQPGVELYKTITNRLHAEAREAGGIESTPEWRAFEESPRQAKWRGSVTLRWDRLNGVDIAPNATAPAVYAGLLKSHFDSRQAEYAELSFFGDTRYALGGRSVRTALDRAADLVFRASRLHAPVDVYEGPAMNHSYHEMIIGHGRCFSTVLLSEAGETIPAAGYTPAYHRAQFLATQIALAERRRPVVSITLKNLDERSLAALAEFFAQSAKHLKE